MGPCSSVRIGRTPSAPEIRRAAASSRVGPTISAPMRRQDDPRRTPRRRPPGGQRRLRRIGGDQPRPSFGRLLTYTKELVAYWHKRGVDPTPDLVTTSGSGYDPDITAQDALVQIPMVSKATGISPVGLAGAHRPGDQRRGAGLHGQQLHRRPATERGTRPAPVNGCEPASGECWGWATDRPSRR